MTNFLAATGDVELDLAHRAAELVASPDFALTGKRNLWTSREQPPDGAVGVAATFVELTAGRNQGSNTDAQRAFDLQLLHRFAGSPPPARKALAAARARMQALYEALHRSGEFVGHDSGARYVEVIALDVPVVLEDRHISLNVTLYRDG
jgi:hypothetical protein